MRKVEALDLLPCPFCGGEAEQFHGFYFRDVQCKICGAIADTAKWNTRTALQSHNSCERLVEALEYIAANNGDDLVGRARTALQEHRAGTGEK